MELLLRHLAVVGFFFFFFLFLAPASGEIKSFLVYLGGQPSIDNAGAPFLADSLAVAESHHDFLGSFLGSKEKAKSSIFYSYTRYINGFAANLEEEEAQQISKHPGVVSVFQNRGHKLHTTRSWRFLGLERDGGRVPRESLWSVAGYGENAIIGNLDTGVWPESESFKDEGMGPIPSTWKGICQNDSPNDFSCNRKLIGARYFNKGYAAAVGPLNSSFNSPRDYDGHGTHTLSTAGGGFVPGASVFGLGGGTAKGGSPMARVAAYKVCWPPVNNSECFDADILAAFDAAIADGVHILSVSLGGTAADYLADGIAIGSFHAAARGVTVVCSAGNSGPAPATVSNTAPWIVTVAASTMDREFRTYASFGNGKRVKGQSLVPGGLPKKKLYPMIYAGDATVPGNTTANSELCMPKSLDPVKVKGKIVVCIRGTNARVEKGLVVRQAGGVGMILANNAASGEEVIADAHVLPATHIAYSDGQRVLSYINSTKSPSGHIAGAKTVLGTKPSPLMAAFSSSGPNTITPEILKPDITAPGVSVLAAFSGGASPTDLGFDTRRVPFNVESGTSMSCPHIAGIAGLLKSLHPEWSPAAIRSAIMTTAKTQDNVHEAIMNSSSRRANPFNYGSGHVRPNRAMDPGLVFDLCVGDYLDFLCAIGYNSSQIANFSSPGSYDCPADPPKLESLNYPSISIPAISVASPAGVVITRRARNVGAPGSTYVARVVEPPGISVTVTPRVLRFDDVGEEKEFEVKVVAAAAPAAGYVFGRLIWSDGKHFVRMPIAVNCSAAVAVAAPPPPGTSSRMELDL